VPTTYDDRIIFIWHFIPTYLFKNYNQFRLENGENFLYS